MGFYILKVSKNVLSLVISDYFRKTINEVWIENSKMTGFKKIAKVAKKMIHVP